MNYDWREPSNKFNKEDYEGPNKWEKRGEGQDEHMLGI